MIAIKIGIYGGSFNPVHRGHINLAIQAKDLLGLDKVILVPGSIPPHKSSENMVSGAHRQNMLSLATKNYKGLEVSDIELKRQGISYTVDTLEQMMREYRGEYYLIMGSDMYRSLRSWYRYRDIVSRVTVVAAPREEGEREELLKLCAEYRSEGFESIVLPISVLTVSSTEIRNGNADSLLEESVADYIRQNRLYGHREFSYPYPLLEYQKLMQEMLDPKRYEHTLNVADEAKELGNLWGVDPEICFVAGMLHDVAKCMPFSKQQELLENTVYWKDAVFRSQTQIWHGFSGAEYLGSELKLYNCEIIEAVRYHSTGKKEMTLLDKIIYVADLTSRERDYPDVETVRELSRTNLDKAVLYILKYTLDKLLRTDTPMIHDTVDAYNSLLL